MSNSLTFKENRFTLIYFHITVCTVMQDLKIHTKADTCYVICTNPVNTFWFIFKLGFLI